MTRFSKILGRHMEVLERTLGDFSWGDTNKHLFTQQEDLANRGACMQAWPPWGGTLWISWISGAPWDLLVADFLYLVSFVNFLSPNKPPSRMEYFKPEEIAIQQKTVNQKLSWNQHSYPLTLHCTSLLFKCFWVEYFIFYIQFILVYKFIWV